MTTGITRTTTSKITTQKTESSTQWDYGRSLTAFTKSFVWLVFRVVGLFTLPGAYSERPLIAKQKRTSARRFICSGIQPTLFNLHSPLAGQVHEHECMDDCLLLVWAISNGTKRPTLSEFNKKEQNWHQTTSAVQSEEVLVLLIHCRFILFNH